MIKKTVIEIVEVCFAAEFLAAFGAPGARITE